jgi:hypothetical protein
MKRVTLPLTVDAMALVDMAVRESAVRAEDGVNVCREVEGEHANHPGSEGYLAGQRHTTLVNLVELFQRCQMYVSFLIGDDEVAPVVKSE